MYIRIDDILRRLGALFCGQFRIAILDFLGTPRIEISGLGGVHNIDDFTAQAEEIFDGLNCYCKVNPISRRTTIVLTRKPKP